MLPIAMLALFVAVMVYRYAWVCEDAFITLRYVDNALNGYGAVFNVGECVQGYTHPLWFLLLLVGTLGWPNPIHVAVASGLACTVLTVVIVGHALRRLSDKPWYASVLTALFCLLCVSSDSWLAFQTSGLENSLSHLLIACLVVEVCRREFSRPLWLTLLIALLVLNRPDLALLIAPLGVLLLRHVRNRRYFIALCIGVLPLAAWLVFAWWYYGSVVPNPAYAKVGMYASWWDGASQGLTYLYDWLRHDLLAAAGAVLLLGLGMMRARTRLSTGARRGRYFAYAWAAGIVLYLLYVVWVGGDFMRGHLLLPVFTAGVVLGLASLAAHARAARPSRRWTAVACIAVLLGLPISRLTAPPAESGIPESGIVDEWRFYPGYHLAAIRRNGGLINPYMDLRFADELRSYATECGPVTIHARNPGTLGFLAGPQVTIIDTLGLNDAFIARLPNAHLVQPHPRPGHPDKYLPVAYLASRGDIALLPDWERAVISRDCSVRERVAQYRDSDALYDPR